MRVAETFTQQASKDTWFHNQHHTGHAIDHILIRWSDAHLQGRALVLRAQATGCPWNAFTDHNPVEIGLFMRFSWVLRPRKDPAPALDVGRLRGVGDEVRALREAYAAAVARKCSELPEGPCSWEQVVGAVSAAGLEVLGTRAPEPPCPWLAGGEEMEKIYEEAHSSCPSCDSSSVSSQRKGTWQGWKEE